MLKVIVNGAHERMGQETVKAVKQEQDFQLVGECDSQDNLLQSIQSTAEDIVIDFTNPTAVYTNALTIIEAGASPVIGTTGMTQEQIKELQCRCAKKKLGGIIAPNFSVGAILMMKYARDAARYLADVEIIEMHHENKVDAPSGTAMKTAEMIAEVRKSNRTDKTEHEILKGARGGKIHGIPIHSVRLPGYVAHQMVMFGGTSESLTIRHDSNHREAFMPGVILACRQVRGLQQVVYGLEHLLD